MFRKYHLFITILSLSFLSCKGKKEENSHISVVSYPVATISQKDTIINFPYVADIQASKNIEVRSRISGMLEKIYIKEGQKVKKGQPLFKISDSELRLDLTRAEARYKSFKAEADVAKVEVERVQLLVDNDVVTQTELDLARAKYNALLAKAEEALSEKHSVEKRIAYTRMTAPFDGIVDRIPLKEGSLITSESLLTTISDITSVYAYFHVSENEYFQLLRNQNSQEDILDIRLEMPDGSVYPYSGQLAPAESEIDGNTGNIAFKVLFKNPEHFLRHGASGKILITRALPNTILIPQKAVFEIQDKNYVFVLQSDSTVKMQNMVISRRLSDYYVVGEGLNSGETIILEGIQAIRDGQKITPRPI